MYIRNNNKHSIPVRNGEEEEGEGGIFKKNQKLRKKLIVKANRSVEKMRNGKATW